MGGRILKGKTSKWDLDTPALLLDMDVFEANLTKLSEYCRENRTAFRPHIKAHKCPTISKKQISSGALGICAAKTTEAEVMADSGIKNILITSPVITPYKIKRLMDVRRTTPGLMVVVDAVKNVTDLSEAAKSNNLKLDVLVDNNIGDDRTGVKPGKPAVDLAKIILKSDGLRFKGIQAYAGFIQHIHGFHERRKRDMECMEKAAESKHLIEKEGIHVEIFTGGGTGTYNIDHNVPGFTDIQPGSYIFMDVDYLAIGGKDSPENLYEDFAPSLTVLATAISQPVKGRITVDAGKKAFATDGPNPVLRDISGISYELMGDEHGGLTFENPSHEIRIGDKVEFIVPHCDPTVNLYDNYYCIRNEIVEDIWEVSGRGMSQ